MFCDSSAVSMVRSIVHFIEGVNFTVSFCSLLHLLCYFPLCTSLPTFLPYRRFSLQQVLFSALKTTCLSHPCSCTSSSPASASSSHCRFLSAIILCLLKAHHPSSPKPPGRLSLLPVFKFFE